MKTLYVLILVSFGLAACTPEQPRSNSKRIFVMGDPLNLIEGATLNQNVDLSFFSGLDAVYLTSMLTFQEKTSNENAWDGGAMPEEIPLPVIQKENSISIIMENVLTLSNFSGETTVEFRNKTMSQEGLLQHFSVSRDGNNFSLLISTDANDTGTQLVSMTFSKRANFKPLPTGNSKYEFINGAGRKLTWPKNHILDIGICGVDDHEVVQSVKSSVALWAMALKGQLQIKTTQRDVYPPFSDLQSQCVYVVKNYFTKSDMSYINFGFTSVFPDYNYPSIGDGDIFIVEKEFSKRVLSSAHSYHYLNYTVLHEIGHLLGLEHQFDGTESIMSYKFDKPIALYPYDIEAIQELYR